MPECIASEPNTLNASLQNQVSPGTELDSLGRYRTQNRPYWFRRGSTVSGTTPYRLVPLHTDRYRSVPAHIGFTRILPEFTGITRNVLEF